MKGPFMDMPEITFSLVLGAGLIVGAIVHEVVWWRRRHWQKVQGQVVGQEVEKDRRGWTYTPEVEFIVGGVRRTFTSRYGRSIP